MMMKQTLDPPSPCPPVGRTRPVARTGSAVASAQRATFNAQLSSARSRLDVGRWTLGVERLLRAYQ